ncbi:MarR family winged helix-turn-helix transcriptional regulator [Caballeronia sp.]|uniref:MarR family winged helix-turn-helix transcriptional regulator n=1 Tax=Caballeronia sp. TaxID=1931223 RepID=UPI003C36AE0A
MRDDHEDSFLPVQRILFALSKARHLLMAELEVALSGTSVTRSQASVLLLLSQDMAHSSVSLSKLLERDPASATRVVDRLERQGLVRRARNCPDRRVVNLTLTEAGRNAATRIAEIVPAMLNRRLSGFTPLEFATLSRLLGKLLGD